MNVRKESPLFLFFLFSFFFVLYPLIFSDLSLQASLILFSPPISLSCPTVAACPAAARLCRLASPNRDGFCSSRCARPPLAVAQLASPASPPPPLPAVAACVTSSSAAGRVSTACQAGSKICVAWSSSLTGEEE